MRQIVVNRTRVRRLGRWLMASASSLLVAGVPQANTLPPLWVVPAMLSDASQPVTPGRDVLRPILPLAPLPASVTGLPLAPHDERFQPLLPLPGVAGNDFVARFASMDVRLEQDLGSRLDSLAQGVNPGSGLMPVRMTSVDAAAGRLRLTTDVMDVGTGEDRRDFRDPQLREAPRDMRGRDVTRRHRIAAQLIDAGSLKLVVDGEFGQIAESFTDNFPTLSNGRFVLPGSWSQVNTRLAFGATNVTVGYQDHETRAEARSREQITVGFRKSELQVYRRQGAEFSLINGGQWLRRTTFSGISADVLVADVLPDAIAETLSSVRHVLPTSVSGAFERGDTYRSEYTVGPRDRVATANIALNWRGRLGDTTASYWERRVSTDLLVPGAEDGVNLAKSTDRYADLSHSVKRGKWKFGAGLSFIQTNDQLHGMRNAGSEVAPHASIAYAPEHGPKVELRFGAADAQSQIVDDNLAARAKTRQLQLSVDLSDYVREGLNRPEANLKLEYRYDFGRSDSPTPTGLREQEGGHAVLLTFSTPLN